MLLGAMGICVQCTHTGVQLENEAGIKKDEKEMTQAEYTKLIEQRVVSHPATDIIVFLHAQSRQ